MIGRFKRHSSIITIGLLLGLSTTSAAPQAAEEKTLAIEIDGNSQLTISANEVTPEHLLTSLGETLGVSIAWTGAPSQAPLISGQFHGTLTELLPRMLRDRRYIAIMGPQGPSRLIVAGEGHPMTILNPSSAERDELLTETAASNTRHMALGFGHKSSDPEARLETRNAAVTSSPKASHQAPPGSVSEMLEGQGVHAASSMTAAYANASATSSRGTDGSLPPRRSRPPSYRDPGAGQISWSKPGSTSPSAAITENSTNHTQAAQLNSLADQAQLALKTLVTGLKKSCERSAC